MDILDYQKLELLMILLQALLHYHILPTYLMDIQLKQLEYEISMIGCTQIWYPGQSRSQFTKTSLKKLRLHPGLYECTDAGGLVRNYVPTIIYLIFKSINPDTRIGLSNLKDEIGKATIDKFGNNVKDLIDEISSKWWIIIDKGELHEDFVRHIFRDILSGPNSHFNHFLKD